MSSFSSSIFRPSSGLVFYRPAGFQEASRTRGTSMLRALCLGLLACLGVGCQTISGLNFYSPEDDAAMGAVAFDQVLTESKVITSGQQHEMVQRVVSRLIDAAATFRPEMVNAFEWKAELLDAPGTVNAFALPGGKMAVYTGILPVTQTEAGLATVMGHEIAHVTERHGTQRLTQQNATNLAVVAYGFLRGDEMSEDEGAIVQLTSQLMLLRYGRDDELESDGLGLKIMAKAGYDPREAVEFWKRMRAQSGGQAPPEWFSTHPSNERRIEQLEAAMPAALSIWQKSQR